MLISSSVLAVILVFAGMINALVPTTEVSVETGSTLDVNVIFVTSFILYLL